MQLDEAKILLGFPLNSSSHPSPSQIKSAYRRKAWETHPDRFPSTHEKALAESNFKLVSEAYNTFLSSSGGGGDGQSSRTASYSRVVVKNGVPRGGGKGQKNIRVAAASVPFLLIIIGSFTLAGSTAARAYTRQKEAHPSFNPFLP